MIRKPKTLGLVIFAVLAISAVVASTAQAVPSFTCSAYPCTTTGSNVVGAETFTTPGGTIQCDSHFEGSISAESSTKTIFIKYTNCRAFGFLNATVNMNGCHIVIHVIKLIASGRYLIIIDIVCPAGKTITISAGTCVVDIPAQTGLNGIESENLGGTVTIKPNVTNITMNVTTDGFGCPFSGTGHTTGAYHGDLTMSRVGGGSASVSGS